MAIVYLELVKIILFKINDKEFIHDLKKLQN